MDNGQHEQLLREVLMNLERLGGDLIEKAQWARNHGLCSKPPGTAGYNNKCKFDDGLFLCVRQVPGERSRWNHVVIGRGEDITHDQPPHRIRWKPDDNEIVDYARAIAPWVASVIHGQEKAHRTCGGHSSSLQTHGKPRKRNRFGLILLTTFAGFMIMYLVKTTSRDAPPKSAIATIKADVAPTERPRASMGVAAQQLLIGAEKRPDPKSRSELSRKEAELDEVKASATSKIEEVIATLDKRGDTQAADSLRRLLTEGNLLGALQLANEQLRDWDPWSRSELSSETRAAMMDKAGVFGVSFATVVAYEMARARVPTPRILKTMETYDPLDESLLRQIDRINKHVDDQHLHYRLRRLSSAIDDALSEKANGRQGGT